MGVMMDVECDRHIESKKKQQANIRSIINEYT